MTKIDIISGFLGAGKTTLIKKLLEEAYKGEQVVLIENEFGEIGIDGGFLKDAGINITEMNSGCICCSLVGDFGAALHDVIEQFHPDRVIIEPSGVGKLSDVIRAVQRAAETTPMELNCFIAVADATKCKMYMKNFGEFFNNQIEHANTIILSRAQNMSEEKMAATVAELRAHNGDAIIITTPWDQITGKQILEAMETHKHDVVTQLMAEEWNDDEECDDPDCCCHDHTITTTTSTNITTMTTSIHIIMSTAMNMNIIMNITMNITTTPTRYLPPGAQKLPASLPMRKSMQP